MAEYKEGVCTGGPMDGKTAVSRFPKGFLLCDKPNGRAWIYEATEEGFTVRDADGEELISDPDAPMNRFRAAEEKSYDVLALGGGE